MNKSLLFSILAMTASVFADGDINNSIAFAEDNLIASDCNPKPKECKPKPPECKPKPKPKPCEPCVRHAVQPIVLTSSRPCNNIGLYLFADALYWHADVGDSDWAFVNNGTTLGVPAGPNKETTFKWNWGFRVGLGVDFEHDQWDSDVYYTWFRNHGSHGSDNSVNLTLPAVASSLNSAFTGTFETGSATSKLDFNVVDWELGRWFYVSNSISLRPHAGLKGAWIELKQDESFTEGLSGGLASYSVNSKTKSWAIGPSCGVNTNWYFGTGDTRDLREHHHGEVRDRPHFSIFGDFAGALMFSHFKNTHDETGLSAAGVTVAGFNPSHLNRNQVVPVLQSILGLAFDTCFGCDKYHLGIKVGYEFQWWFRQNQRLYVVDTDILSSPRYIRAPDDLALQGLTVDVRFDF